MVQVSSGAWILISGALLGGVILALPRIKAEVEDSPLGPKDKDAVVSDWSSWSKCKYQGKKGILKIGGYRQSRTRTVLEEAVGDGKTPDLKETRKCKPNIPLKIGRLGAESNHSFITPFY